MRIDVVGKSCQPPRWACERLSFSRTAAQAGHFDRHFNVVVGIDSMAEHAYTLKVPDCSPMDEEVTSLRVPCLLAHKALGK